MYDNLTASDIKKMQEEIEYRKLVVRKEALEAVKEARAQGDLSENFEYKAAKQDKNRNESRIRYLERMIKTARIIPDTSKADEAGIGDRVEIYIPEDDETETYKLVTTVRGNSLKGLISIDSPLGKALKGRKVGDKIYVIGGQKELDQFYRELNLPSRPIRSISVLGGSRVATYLGWAMDKLGVRMKLVEQDAEKCLLLADKLPNALVIHGDGTDQHLLEAEGVLESDAFVALTNRDEENLLMALSAQRKGVRKVIAKMSRLNYIELMRDAGVDSIISPKDITASQITAYVRSLANSRGSAVEHLYKLLDGAMEAVMFTATTSTRFLNTQLKDLNLKKGLLVAAIVRQNRTIIPDGNAKILDGDKVIVMAKSLFLQDLNDILQ